MASRRSWQRMRATIHGLEVGVVLALLLAGGRAQATDYSGPLFGLR